MFSILRKCRTGANLCTRVRYVLIKVQANELIVSLNVQFNTNNENNLNHDKLDYNNPNF
jgi:hypothetical protein